MQEVYENILLKYFNVSTKGLDVLFDPSERLTVNSLTANSLTIISSILVELGVGGGALKMKKFDRSSQPTHRPIFCRFIGSLWYYI